MARTFILLALALISAHSHAQSTIKVEEIRNKYLNGILIFNICTSGCQTSFDNDKKYYWYTEFSEIKSTKGGSGGSLLHGNYRFYDVDGNLRNDYNYFLGLPDGIHKTWDSLGNITSITNYDKDEIVYWKFMNDEGYWIEHIGKIFSEGWVKKSYTKYNILITEQRMMPNFILHVKTYYEFGNNKLKADYYSTGSGSDYFTGKFTTYYESGKVKTEGQYSDIEYTNIKVGSWKWYKPDGTLEATYNYKAYNEKWDNGRNKVAGGFIYDTESNTWLKEGEWIWYAEKGGIQDKKKYEWGEEIIE